MNHRIQSSLKPATQNENILPIRHADETTGEKALWRAVITQALMDAGSQSSKRESRFDRAQAISWLSGRSRDFGTVCALAELDPDYVLEKTREALKRGCAWREEKAARNNPAENAKVLNLQNYLERKTSNNSL